ncbi:outer membrane protein assembly factor BamB family protein [Haloglomus irregulare]|nr:PQQ-binding-like beta-propeller repeat protein [Haloglomus irregulare]
MATAHGMKRHTSRRQFVSGAVCGSIVGGLAGRAAGARAQERSPIVWSASVGGTVTAYAVTATDVYIGTDRNRVRHVDRASGEPVATVDLEAGVHPGGIAVTDEHLVVATRDDRLAVYRTADLAGDDATPTYRTQLPRPVGMDTRDGLVALGTRDGLFVLDPAAGAFRWQLFTDELDVDFLAPPLVWSDGGIVLTGDTSVLFVDPETGELSVRVPFEAPNHVDVLSHLPAAITTAGPYVAYTGSDTHGCCPSWATFVVDTETREFVYRDFARTSDATPQRAGAVTESAVVHQRGHGTVRRRSLDGTDEFQLDYDPRLDGIAATTDRTFVADGSGLEATNTGQNLERGPTELVAVDNEGYGIAWSHTFDTPITRLRADGEFLFGVDRAEGRLVAMAQSGDGVALRPAATDSETPSQPTATASGGTADDGSGTSNPGAASTGPATATTPSRGFLTNGDDQVLEGVGLTGLSIVITIGGILVTLYDMVRGGN